MLDKQGEEVRKITGAETIVKRAIQRCLMRKQRYLPQTRDSGKWDRWMASEYINSLRLVARLPKLHELILDCP